jgi:hypothetical protein
MSMSIEQQVEALLKHAEVWDETKETLRDLLAEAQAGTLDPDDARYVEGLHKKMFSGRGPSAPVRDTPPRSIDMSSVKAANDDVTLRSARRGLSSADLIEALRLDIADLVVPKDLAERPQAEQDLRKELLEALEATIKEFDEN